MTTMTTDTPITRHAYLFSVLCVDSGRVLSMHDTDSAARSAAMDSALRTGKLMIVACPCAIVQEL